MTEAKLTDQRDYSCTFTITGAPEVEAPKRGPVTITLNPVDGSCDAGFDHARLESYTRK